MDKIENNINISWCLMYKFVPDFLNWQGKKSFHNLISTEDQIFTKYILLEIYDIASHTT